MKPIYVILLADKQGNFDWMYTDPKPYYDTKQEAEKIREELIEQEETVTEENSKVQKLWRLTNKSN